MLAGASSCAQAIKLQHAIELLETQTLYSFNNYIQSLFEQAAQNKTKAVQNLVKQGEFNAANISLKELLARLQTEIRLDILQEEVIKDF